MNKWYFVCSILIVVIIAESVFFLNLNNMYISLSLDNDSLKVERQALIEAHDSLSENYSSLKTNYTNLESEYNILWANLGILQSNYTALQNKYQNLEENYTFVQAQYDSLQVNYTTLMEDFNTLEVQYNSLQTAYNNLQAEYDRYSAAYERLRDEINNRWNEQNVELFITSPDPLVNTTVFDITGGWSNTSDWNEYWDDVKAMYDWVVDNIEYRFDGLFPMLPSDPSGETDYFMEMWQFPNETLALGKGDCEDMAILLCSMIRGYNNMEHYVECIGIVSSIAGHLAVQVPVAEHKLVILDPAGGYYSSDFLGNIVFRDVTEEINNWLDYWKPTIGEDVYVNLVFSDYIHETFTSTTDYLSWMYTR
jgi:hypothetical protein